MVALLSAITYVYQTAIMRIVDDLIMGGLNQTLLKMINPCTGEVNRNISRDLHF